MSVAAALGPTRARTADLVLVGLWLWPLAFLLLVASADEWPTTAVLPASYTADRWVRLLADPTGLLAAVGRSLTIAMVVATVSTALGFIASKALSESPHATRWLALAHLPFGFSPVILGACLSFFALLSGLSGSVTGVALAQISVGSAFAVVFCWGIWTPRLREFEGVARTLGSSPLQAWYRVVWPLCRPRVLVCWAQTFFFSWMQYGLTVTVGAGKVRTLPLLVYDYVFEADPGYAAVAALLLVGPVLALLAFDPRAGATSSEPS